MIESTPFGTSPTTGGSRSVPVEIRGLDDAHLVASSEGDVSSLPGAPQAVPPDAGGCCQTTFDPAAIDMEPYVEVVFKGERRGYYLNRTGQKLMTGDYAVVEAEKGEDLGMVYMTGKDAYVKSRLRLRPCEEEPKKILRRAVESDIRVLNYHREQELTAFDNCLEKIRKLGLPMKLVDVEFQFDRNRITFYFTADGRVDFRELVRLLASEYRTRIELRQIGPRDEARRVGGFGVCGRELCCNAWLSSFEPISTEMAKLQNLALNPAKLSGQCGRLKCCLAYELQMYAELLKRFPPLEYTFTTVKGLAKIEKIDVFQDAIFVHYREGDSWERYTLDQIEKLLDTAGTPQTQVKVLL